MVERRIQMIRFPAVGTAVAFARLEGADPMQVQAVGLPDPLDEAQRDPDPRGDGA